LRLGEALNGCRAAAVSKHSNITRVLLG